MSERERELIKAALAQLKEMGGSRTKAIDCLEIALDENGPTYDEVFRSGSSYMGASA